MAMKWFLETKKPEMTGHELADRLYRLGTAPALAPPVVLANACRDGANEIKRLQSKLEERAMNEAATRQGYSHQREVERTQRRSEALRHAVDSSGSAANTLEKALAFDAFLAGSAINRIDGWPRDDKNSRVDVQAAIAALNEKRQKAYAELDNEQMKRTNAEEAAALADQRYKQCTADIIQIEAGIKALGGKLEPIKLGFGRGAHREGGAEANTAQGEQATDGCAQAPQGQIGPFPDADARQIQLYTAAAVADVKAKYFASHNGTPGDWADSLLSGLRSRGLKIVRE